MQVAAAVISHYDKKKLSHFNSRYMRDIDGARAQCRNGVGAHTIVDVAVKYTLAANTLSCVECDLIFVASSTV